MNGAKELELEISAWPNVTVHPHRFGGRECFFGKAELGHVHWGRTLDIPFTRVIRDALIAEGLAEEHRWAPNSGWVTFHIRGAQDFDHALWLIRLSSLRYALKTTPDAHQFLEREAHAMHLTSTYHSLLERFIPASNSQPQTEQNRTTPGNS